MRIGPLIAALGAGSESLMQSRAMERAERDRQQQLRNIENQREKENLDLELRLRNSGYVPEGEATADGSVSGQTLDEIVSAASGIPTVGMQGTGTRYSGGPKGYKYDRMSEPALEKVLERRKREADARKIEREVMAPRSVGNVDPLSPEGIRASAEKARVVAQAEAPFKKEPAPSQPTDYERRAAFLVPKAEEAARVLVEFYDKGAPLKSALSRVPIVGNYALSADEQRLQQAANAVSASILRLESGGSITEQEIEQNAKQFLPQPGDSKEVLEQKRSLLMQAVASMRQAVGRAGSMTTPAPSGPKADTSSLFKKYGLEP